MNIAAGYYEYHYPTEYVVFEDVENSFNLACELSKELGNKKYMRFDEVRTNWAEFYNFVI